MIEKLQIIQQRFDEVTDLIIQPDIILDQKRYIKLNKEYKTENALDNINLKPYNRNQKILPYNSIFNESDDYRIKIKNYNIYNKPLGFKCQRNYNDCTQLYLLK